MDDLFGEVATANSHESVLDLELIFDRDGYPMKQGELNAIFLGLKTLLVAFHCFFESLIESFVGRVVLRAPMNEASPGK